jgi:dTMP kinase
MNGKIIVIEGLDGCGKTTQFEMLKNDFSDFKFITFPHYESLSGQIITKYLHGEIAETNPQHSAYSASSFYAIDRYISFKNDWEKDYNEGKTIISARYTTSNAFYQMTKTDKSMWKSYCNWLFDYEYNKLGIPKPDKMIFLDVPVDISQKLLSNRYNGNENKKDIHESDIEYLNKCRESAMYAIKNYDCDKWSIIDCCKNGQLCSAEMIHNEIISVINSVIE